MKIKGKGLMTTYWLLSRMNRNRGVEGSEAFTPSIASRMERASSVTFSEASAKVTNSRTGAAAKRMDFLQDFLGTEETASKINTKLSKTKNKKSSKKRK